LRFVDSRPILIEPKAPLFAYGCWGALYKYFNTIQYNTRAYFSVQLITICAVVKSKCAV